MYKLEKDFKNTGVNYTIKAEVLDDTAQEQFLRILSDKNTKYASLQADAHGGYIAPIGAVILTEDVIVPQYVGFDIGCGMCAYKTPFHKDDLSMSQKEEIHALISKSVPTGMTRQETPQKVDVDLPSTDLAKNIVENTGVYQLGTLGGGNHFMEIGYSDQSGEVWIVIHSGSRGVGAKIAQHYMSEAYRASADYNEDITYESYFSDNHDRVAAEFLERNEKFKEHNPEGFSSASEKYVNKVLEKEFDKIIKDMNIAPDELKKIYPLDVNSKVGLDYIQDLNYALDFALENRKHMASTILDCMNEIMGTDYQFTPIGEESNNDEDVNFINRNHNHAEHSTQFGGWIHRKGATHADLGMLGVIPGNMRDGSFIVRGLGNKDTLNSSSHGAGRVLSRSQANKKVVLSEYEKTMEGIVGTVNENTRDEAPEAYKNIFEVMDAQTDCVEVIERVIPLINVKDDTPSKY